MFTHEEIEQLTALARKASETRAETSFTNDDMLLIADSCHTILHALKGQVALKARKIEELQKALRGKV